jgi:hypothetical protein
MTPAETAILDQLARYEFRGETAAQLGYRVFRGRPKVAERLAREILDALNDAGLVERYRLGQLRGWRITDAGRLALAEKGRLEVETKAE